MVQVTVGRWGNNLAVRFPGEIVKLRDGERVEIDLFRGRSRANGALDAGAYDWGPDIGREIVLD